MMRSRQFNEYLATLPLPERERIEDAERRWLRKSEAPHSRQRRAARDFGAVMAGVREDIPWYLTRR